MFKGFNGQQGHQADQGAHFQGDNPAIGYVQGVIKKAVLLIPQAQAAAVIAGRELPRFRELYEIPPSAFLQL